MLIDGAFAVASDNAWITSLNPATEAEIGRVPAGTKDDVNRAVDAYDWAAKGLTKPEILLNGQPEDESVSSVLWDGEWEITWVTFRDMGGAFMVALLGIYILVVAQFRSFRLPLVILTPIPLTLVGIVIGHMLFGAPFTATSMITGEKSSEHFSDRPNSDSFPSPQANSPCTTCTAAKAPAVSSGSAGRMTSRLGITRKPETVSTG